MYLAPTRKAALAAYDQFISSYQTKFVKACECLHKDKEVLFTFYGFPAQHLAAFTDYQPHRIDLRYRPIANSPNQGLRFTNRDTDHGL
jgi:transposase-like protein